MTDNTSFEAPRSPLQLLNSVPESTLRRLRQYSGRLATQAVHAMSERLPFFSDLEASQRASVQLVVVDEWHELMGTKRGVQTELCLADLSTVEKSLVRYTKVAKAGGDMQHIPMKSTGDAVNEVLAGRVHGVTGALTALMGFRSDPRIKLLAYTGNTRSKFMPELPTVAEAGVAGYKFDSWIGLLGPSGMPKAEVDRIYDLFVETVARHRGLDADTVRATEAGLFFGPDAVATGLADAVGSLDDALTQLTQSLSPLPTQVAPASQAGFLRNHQMESSMNDRTDPAAPDRPLADPAGSHPQPSATATATALSVADAVEIAQTCTLAGRTDLIAGFLEAQSSPAKVRSQLLSAQAEASPEITSLIRPDSAADAARISATSPLIDAAKQIAAQSTKKEI